MSDDSNATRGLTKDRAIEVLGKHHAYDFESYMEKYNQSILNPDDFWRDMTKRLSWFNSPKKIKNVNLTDNSISIKWFEDGILNACYNCVDRHALSTPNKVAINWQGNEDAQQKSYTFSELKSEVSSFANVLKSSGVKKGDIVTIYMPMVPEAIFSMLACARIGAVHSVVFGGFSAESLATRINDCNSTYVITSPYGVRGAKKIPLKSNVDKARADCPLLKKVLVINSYAPDGSLLDGDNIDSPFEVDYKTALSQVDDNCECEKMSSIDPLFILYTSGSTGTPKGLVHSTGGYLLYVGLTFETSFDYKDGDVYWCTADVGWITGHSYMVYGPLSVGAQTVVFEGVPTYPDPSRFWQVVDKYKVSIFYTAPTAIRALLSMGDKYVECCDLSSLRILATVGEPINVEAWDWFYNLIGKGRCPIIDTWWQTETGGHMVTPIPYLWDLKPAKASYPTFGVNPAIIDSSGDIVKGVGSGSFCLSGFWPGQAMTIYGNDKKFFDTYFKDHKGYYFTGDGAERDSDGYIRITGRMDDVLNVSGHRMGTAEIEDAFNCHQLVAESAIVGYDHPIKGEGIYAFCILKEGSQSTDLSALCSDLKAFVRSKIGAIATPDFIQISTGLPKTRSGKIMRRILRKIANDDTANLGDISTLADSEVVGELVENRLNKPAER